LIRLLGAVITVGLAAGHGVANALDADDLAGLLGPGTVVALVAWLVGSLAGVVRGTEPEPFSWKKRKRSGPPLS